MIQAGAFEYLFVRLDLKLKSIFFINSWNAEEQFCPFQLHEINVELRRGGEEEEAWVILIEEVLGFVIILKYEIRRQKNVLREKWMMTHKAAYLCSCYKEGWHFTVSQVHGI